MSRTRLRTEALLVRAAPFGEADVMVTLFTEAEGTLSAVARSARRSQRRFPALEPMHLLRVGLEQRAGHDAASLAESAIVRPRLGIIRDLARMEAAGAALRWVRRAAPPHHAEPALWREINVLLDRLDADEGVATPRVMLAGAGLRMLAAIGWGLDLGRCVRCGRVPEPEAAACVDPAEGGLVCRACGGARLVLRPSQRQRLVAASEGDDAALRDVDAAIAMDLVEAALAAHSGLG